MTKNNIDVVNIAGKDIAFTDIMSERIYFVEFKDMYVCHNTPSCCSCSNNWTGYFFMEEQVYTPLVYERGQAEEIKELVDKIFGIDCKITSEQIFSYCQHANIIYDRHREKFSDIDKQEILSLIETECKNRLEDKLRNC